MYIVFDASLSLASSRSLGNIQNFRCVELENIFLTGVQVREPPEGTSSIQSVQTCQRILPSHLGNALWLIVTPMGTFKLADSTRVNCRS